MPNRETWFGARIRLQGIRQLLFLHSKHQGQYNLLTNILIGEVIESINRPIGSKLTPPVAATGWLWSTETSETHKHLTKPWQTASVTVNGGIRLLLLHEDVWSAGRLDAENRTVLQPRREVE